MRAEKVPVYINDKTYYLVPWLASVNGVNLAEPRNLSVGSLYQFSGNPVLEIFLVPENFPSSLPPKSYAGVLIFTFSD